MEDFNYFGATKNFIWQTKEQKRRAQESQELKRSHIRQLLKKKKDLKDKNSQIYKIYKSWQISAGISKKDFWKGLCWLALDPMNGGGEVKRVTACRELGCSKKEGMVKLERVYAKSGEFYGRYRLPENKILGGYAWHTTSYSPSITIWDALV